MDAGDPVWRSKFPFHTLHHLPCLCVPLLQPKQEEGKRYKFPVNCFEKADIGLSEVIMSFSVGVFLNILKPIVSHSAVSVCSAEEAEFRLVSLMPDHANQPDEPYMQRSESQRPSKSQRPLPPLPCPRGPPAVEPQ